MDREFYSRVSSLAPDYLQLSAEGAQEFCIVNNFPLGILYPKGYTNGDPLDVGRGGRQLLPGVYEYRKGGDNRVRFNNCILQLNRRDSNFWEAGTEVSLTYGEPFTFQFFEYHEKVYLYCPSHNYWEEGGLYRIGD